MSKPFRIYTIFPVPYQFPIGPILFSHMRLLPVPNPLLIPNLCPFPSFPRISLLTPPPNPWLPSFIFLELFIRGPSPPSFPTFLWLFYFLSVYLTSLWSQDWCHMHLSVPKDCLAEYERCTQVPAAVSARMLWIGCVSGPRNHTWLVHYIPSHLFYYS